MTGYERVRIKYVDGGRGFCSACDGLCHERVGYVTDDSDVDRVPWVWFECGDCRRTTSPIPLTPGVAILVTGMMPK